MSSLNLSQSCQNLNRSGSGTTVSESAAQAFNFERMAYSTSIWVNVRKSFGTLTSLNRFSANLVEYQAYNFLEKTAIFFWVSEHWRYDEVLSH